MDTVLHFGLGNALLATVMAMVTLLVSRLCRRPALAHGLWLLVLIKLVTPSFLPVPMQKLLQPKKDVAPGGSVTASFDPGAQDEEAAGPAQPDPRLATAGAAPEVAERPTDTLLAAAPVPATQESPAPSAAEADNAGMPAFAVPWRAVCVEVWLLGSVCWFVLAGARLVRFRRLLGCAQAAPQGLQVRARDLARRVGLRRPPRVLILSAAVSPMLWALGGMPTLLLPASLLQRLNGEQWDTLLAHELAHLRRRDHWVRVLEMLALGLYWWLPVVWWARRELRAAEEECCDAWVLWALPDSGEAYALALVETVMFLSQSRTALPLAASGIGHVDFLKRRLIMIMRGSTPRALSGVGFVAVVVLGALLLPWLPTWTQTEAAQAPNDDAPLVAADEPEQDAPPVARPAFPGGDRGLQPPGLQRTGPFGGRRAAQGNAEQTEDARDEVELLSVQLQGKRAEMQEAKALIKQAQRNMSRLQRLVGSGSVDRTELEHAQTEVEVLEARLQGKQAQVQEAELRLKQAQRHLSRLDGARRSRAESPRAIEAPQNFPPADAPVDRPGAAGESSRFAPSPAPEGRPPSAGGDDTGRFAQPPQPMAGPGGRMPGMPGVGGMPRPGMMPPGMPSGPGMLGAAAPGGTRSGMGGGVMGGSRSSTGSGGMMGGSGTGGFRAGGGMSGVAPGDFDRRLSEMEKSLRALADEVRSLRNSSALSRNEALLQDLVNQLKKREKDKAP